MAIEGNFNLRPERKRDMGNPSQFFFTPEERKKLKTEGVDGKPMDDAEIDALEVVITNRQIEERERKDAA